MGHSSSNKLAIARDKFSTGKKVRGLATSPLPSKGSPHVTAENRTSKSPQLGLLATSPLPFKGSPMAHTKSEQAHKWVHWLGHPCHLGVPRALRVGDKFGSGPKVATLPLPSTGSPMLQATGQNQKWPIYGLIGYVTPTAWGVPNASKLGTK